jgi:hypothetical protein
MTAKDVVRISLNNLHNGGLLLPGLLPKFLYYSMVYLPRRKRVQVMGKVMRDMTEGHRAKESHAKA